MRSTSADWYPSSTTAGNRAFVQAYIKKYGGSPDDIDPSSAEAFATGQVLQDVAKKTGKIDNKSIIATLHSGSWPTILGDLSWNQYGSPKGTSVLVQWRDGKLLPVYPQADAQAKPLYPKPNWGG